MSLLKRSRERWFRRLRDSVPTAAKSSEEAALFRSYFFDGDLESRERLVVHYLPLADALVRRFAHGRDDDLSQVGALALVKAVDRFDPTRGFAFSSYAVPTIVGELKRHRRDHGWAVKPPRALIALSLKLPAVAEKLHAKLGRSPSVAELADALGVSAEQVLEATEAGNAQYAASLESPGRDEEGDSRLIDSLGAIDQRFERADDLMTVLPTLRVLPPRERLIVFLRFERDMTQREIAQRVGVSQMHVSRLLRKALDRAGDAVAA